jgi:hypothetical protein
MEFWEGAVLIVGGLWLVGRMSRASATSPINKVPVTASSIGTVGPQGNTVSTSTDGSTALIAGEPLTPMAPPLIIARTISPAPIATVPFQSPIISRPVATPIKAVPGIGTTPARRFTAL